MSSVAINRRIARDSRSFSNNLINDGDNTNNNSNLEIAGNTSQQLYSVATFHENRLNQVFKQVHFLSAKLDKMEPETNLRLHRLEQENASLRKQIASLMSSMNTANSVSLNVNEKSEE